ncbi:hypothetical protein THARTR1_07774 [Trichoderma harzianum]|uniref:Uncharacterized protein n=1 Tax=Trichoderma harzianum TaxID=5544 RepID=A0A2K0U1L4_TRIHA|nr:hypothetical protein THARTR1_07774 [Trichoderma harzianum]
MAITRSALEQVKQAVRSRAPGTKLRDAEDDGGRWSLEPDVDLLAIFKSATATVAVIAEMQAMPPQKGKQAWYVKCE